MKYVIDTAHRSKKAPRLANVAEKELDPLIAQGVPHILLFLFVPAEDADLGNFGFEIPANDGIAKGAGPARNQQSLVFKHLRSSSGKSPNPIHRPQSKFARVPPPAS